MITESASVPERDVSRDPTLVMEAKQELAAESDAAPELRLPGNNKLRPYNPFVVDDTTGS